MKIITATGFYHKNNLGDESYKLAFPQVFPDYEWRFTDNLTPKIINESDALVLGGGDVMHEPFLKQFKNVKKPKHIISASCTKSTDENQLKDFQNIIVRDFKSIEILKEKGLTVQYAPDIAFSLLANETHGKQLIRKEFKSRKLDLYEKTVVVVFNGYLTDPHTHSHNSYDFCTFHKFAHDIAHVIDFTNASFIFIPFGQRMPWDDRVPNMWIAQRCKFWKKNTVFNECSVQNALDIIAASDAVISTRLHSTIFSIAAGTPFIDVTHNHKNAALLETIEKKSNSISYFAFDVDKMQQMLKDIIYREKDYYLINKQREFLSRIKNIRLA